mgnify:CR=1 FL=1
MKVAYLSSAYLAPVEYYSKLLNYDKYSSNNTTIT